MKKKILSLMVAFQIGALTLLIFGASQVYAEEEAVTDLTTLSVAITADEDISMPPQITDIIPIGNSDDPDIYHIQIQTEPLVLVYITDLLKRTSTHQSNEQGFVWIELDLKTIDHQSLQIVSMDYWGNTAMSEVSLSRNKFNKTSFDVSYSAYNQTGKEIQTLAKTLTQKASEQRGSDVVEDLESTIIAVAERQEGDFSSKLTGSAHPLMEKVEPFGYYIFLVGFSLIVIGLYYRANPLPPTRY